MFLPSGTMGNVVGVAVSCRAGEEIIAGADYLRSLPWVRADAGIGVLGFCLGGGLALLALRACHVPDAHPQLVRAGEYLLSQDELKSP